MKLVILALSSLLLFSCGSKGGLYLPEQENNVVVDNSNNS